MVKRFAESGNEDIERETDKQIDRETISDIQHKRQKRHEEMLCRPYPEGRTAAFSVKPAGEGGGPSHLPRLSSLLPGSSESQSSSHSRGPTDSTRSNSDRPQGTGQRRTDTDAGARRETRGTANFRGHSRQRTNVNGTKQDETEQKQ